MAPLPRCLQTTQALLSAPYRALKFLIKGVLKFLGKCCGKCCSCSFWTGTRWTQHQIFTWCFWFWVTVIIIFVIFFYCPQCRDAAGSGGGVAGEKFMELSRWASPNPDAPKPSNGRRLLRVGTMLLFAGPVDALHNFIEGE